MSKKIQNGKFVERTAEDESRFQRLKAEYYGKVGGPSNSKPKRSKEAFAKITASQFEKLMHIKSGVSARLFIALTYQAFKHWGKPFQMLPDNFVKNGFSLTTQWRALTELEKVGLISVERRPRQQPPIVTVL
jgi:hypothetical protein